MYAYNADYGIPSGHPLVCCFPGTRWYGHLHIGQVLFSIYRGSNIVDIMQTDTGVCVLGRYTGAGEMKRFASMRMFEAAWSGNKQFVKYDWENYLYN